MSSSMFKQRTTTKPNEQQSMCIQNYIKTHSYQLSYDNAPEKVQSVGKQFVTNAGCDANFTPFALTNSVASLLDNNHIFVSVPHLDYKQAAVCIRLYLSKLFALAIVFALISVYALRLPKNNNFDCKIE